MTFEDRRDAGRRLGEQLRECPLSGDRPVVLGLPRGGVPVAAEVARSLAAPLDILGVRKLGAPGNPELAIGAVAEDGTGVLDGDLARRYGVTDSTARERMQHEAHALRVQVMRHRGGLPPVDVRGRSVIVVDDGLATGLTTLAAVRAVRARGAARIIVAVPVGSPDAVEMLRREATDIICLHAPPALRSVGEWYEDFTQVTSSEVTGLLTAAATGVGSRSARRDLVIEAGDVLLPADLAPVRGARGLVIFAHGSGSNRRSPRNRHVAAALREAGFATLLVDLVPDAVPDEDDVLVFDVPLRAERLTAVISWARANLATRELPIGLFGASTGAAAALIAAAQLGDVVGAVVSRGGRPDLAGEPLATVTAPTLMIVGGADRAVLQLNRRAASVMHCPIRLEVVDDAGHLFAEPGALDAVGQLAIDWFATYLSPHAAGSGDANAVLQAS